MIYNHRGIFGNAGDTLEGITKLFMAHFPIVATERVGQVGLFVARNQ
jgi:hypothetical protein